MSIGQIEAQQAAISDICRRNGIRRLALFGSALTSRFSDASDIDLLVDFDPNLRVGFFRLAEIESELSQALGGRRVDLRTRMDLSRYFRAEVERDAVPLYDES